MHLIAVKEIPEIDRKKTGRNDICALLDEFMKAKFNKAEVVISKNEYSTAEVAYRTIFTCINNCGYSNSIRVMKRGSHIYMMKIRRNKSIKK